MFSFFLFYLLMYLPVSGESINRFVYLRQTMNAKCLNILDLGNTYMVVLAYRSWLGYSFTETWKTTLAAHIMLFNGHHEHITLYITARRHTHINRKHLKLFLQFSTRENKIKTLFLNLVNSLRKNMEQILLIADDIYNILKQRCQLLRITCSHYGKLQKIFSFLQTTEN